MTTEYNETTNLFMVQHNRPQALIAYAYCLRRWYFLLFNVFSIDTLSTKRKPIISKTDEGWEAHVIASIGALFFSSSCCKYPWFLWHPLLFLLPCLNFLLCHVWLITYSISIITHCWHRSSDMFCFLDSLWWVTARHTAQSLVGWILNIALFGIGINHSTLSSTISASEESRSTVG